MEVFYYSGVAQSAVCTRLLSGRLEVRVLSPEQYSSRVGWRDVGFIRPSQVVRFHWLLPCYNSDMKCDICDYMSLCKTCFGESGHCKFDFSDIREDQFLDDLETLRREVKEEYMVRIKKHGFKPF